MNKQIDELTDDELVQLSYQLHQEMHRRDRNAIAEAMVRNSIPGFITNHKEQ